MERDKEDGYRETERLRRELRGEHLVDWWVVVLVGVILGLVILLAMTGGVG